MILDKSPRLAAGAEAGASRRIRNREATIHAVLESAQRLFGSKGYDRTSLVDIAAETGLSPRGVILHFSSKADIAAELMLRDLRARIGGFRADTDGLAGAGRRILAFFAWMAEGDRRSFINFPALWAFSARWSERVEAMVAAATADLLAPVGRAIEDGIAAGEFRRVDVDAARQALWLGYMAGLRRAVVLGGKPADALPHVEQTIALLRA